MNDLITLDFETRWSNEYTLRKMTTEEYVRDARFYSHMLGCKVNNEPAFTVAHDEIPRLLADLQLENKAVVAFNAQFDGFILSEKYNVRPGFWLDPLHMSYFFYPETFGLKSRSLKALLELYNLPPKGDELAQTIGCEFLTGDLYKRIAKYCENDVEQTHALLQAMLSTGTMPWKELQLVDMTIRLYTEPSLTLDKSALEAELLSFRERRENTYKQFGISNVEDGVKMLRKNDTFAELLTAFGVTPEMKPSPRTPGKMNYAFAKTDDFMQELLEHENERVAMLADLKLNANSSILETRLQRMVGIAERGTMPVATIYSKARTGRWGGSEKLNPQNFKKGSAMRTAIEAPAGKLIGVADSSNIEARMLATWAGQTDLILQFANKEDAYLKFAIEVYQRPLNKKDNPLERFVGKTCIAEGTLVLSHQGWKPIEAITTDDLLWDGQEWVCHQGLVNNGIKPTLNLCGAWLTPDHLILSGTQWLETQSVLTDESILCRALDTGAENLPLQATLLGQEAVSARCWLNATVMNQNTESISKISKILRALGVRFALRKLQALNGIGHTAKRCLTMPTELGYLTGLPQRLAAAIPQLAASISTTADAELKYATSGAQIAQLFLGTFKRLVGGITRRLKWIELTRMETTNRRIYGSYHEATISKTNEKSKTLKRVFDILNSGSRNRFTILTNAGPLVVHNCILGLGYGTGANKLQHTLHVGQGGISVDLDIQSCVSIVQKYRNLNANIVELWERVGYALETVMVSGGDPITVGHNGIDVVFLQGAVLLPSGRVLQYPNLHWEDGVDDRGRLRRELKYGYGRFAGTRIYKTKLVENIVQALARDVVAYQLLEAATIVDKMAMFTHDELVFIHNESTIHEVFDRVIEIMSRPPQPWANMIPLAAEGGIAKNYKK